MADLTLTAASVLAGSGASIKHGTAGATITAGQQLYLDTATDTWKLADSNGASAAIRTPTATSLHASLAGQPITVLTSGPITIGAALTAGVAYYLSDTPGGICPVADLATGEYPTIIGIATSATVLEVDYTSSGVALA